MNNSWTFTHRYSPGPTPSYQAQPIELWWWLDGDSITDDYTADEISADKLFYDWLQRPSIKDAEDLNIAWMVHPVSEEIPFIGAEEDFLSFYTWPRHSETEEQLKWTQLPVRDKAWNVERGDKGGFIQEHTGWKPSPFQRTLHLPTLLKAIGYTR